MTVVLDFWEKGSANIVRSYVIVTESSGVEANGERFIARIRPAASNFPAGEGYDPAWGSSDIEAKDKAVAVIRARPESVGLKSFEKKVQPWVISSQGKPCFGRSSSASRGITATIPGSSC